MKYTNDKSSLILLSLIKAYNIKRVIASPGTTNMSIVGSMQHDDFFEMYSVIDERSAGYMACGMAAESGQPVILLCTEATASRNYYPAITEAYYRKLPILVIAGSHGEEFIGHLHSQTIDRTQSPNDTYRYKAFVKPTNNSNDEWGNIIVINKALISLNKNGGGPSLINIVANPSCGFDTLTLPKARKIQFYKHGDEMPPIEYKRVAIFVGAHQNMSERLSKAIDSFCSIYDSVVFTDHTGGYYGNYKVNFALVCSQIFYDSELIRPDLLIHIGEVSGDTYTTSKLKPNHVWRVSSDGEIKDFFGNTEKIFDQDELSFFQYYCKGDKKETSYLKECKNIYNQIYNNLPDFNFGNLFIAKFLSKRLPIDSILHFSIFNTLRSWNFFEINNSIQTSCNVGGFGIDGAVSTIIGASLVDIEKIHFLITGDLAFFYDINSLGNRHIGKNVRILIINNGRGVEFRKKDHPGYQFGSEADKYIAAGGHFGNMSSVLVKHFCEDLGFKYLTANNPNDFKEVSTVFLSKDVNGPIVFEVFVDVDDEIDNLDKLRHVIKNKKTIKDSITNAIRLLNK